MGEVAQNFITRFYSLQGETLKERHQNLFHLLHEHLHLKNNPEELEFITANLNATNHLEKILRVDFLIYFRQFNELYQDFIKGDEITVKKLSRQGWFFETAFKNVSSGVFVDNILPTVSYSMKLRILRKLPLDEQQADEFFDAVYERYGLFLATNLLPKCTSQKIREVLTTYPVKLSVAQLKAIFNEHSNLIFVYLEERMKHEGGLDFLQRHPILVYIAQKNPEVFCSLYSKYYFSTNLGRRTTKRIICSQKDKVSNDLENYVNILNKHATVRKMGSDVQNVYFKKDSFFASSYNWRNILKYYPKRQRFNLYKSAYDAFFYEKFDVGSISDDTLKLISDPEEREMWAKKKAEEDENDYYLRYAKPDYCLKEVMEKINTPDRWQRNQYIENAAHCCVFNEDVSSLLKVCELVCGRFKNDNKAIRSTLLDMLGKAESLLDKFSKKHWRYVIELIATIKARREWLYYEHILISKYIVFSLKNNIPIKEVIQKPYNWEKILLATGLRRNKEVFKLTMKELLEADHIRKDYGLRMYGLFAYACKRYNEENPNDLIDICNNSKIIQLLKELLQTEDEKYPGSECISGVEYMVCQKNTSKDLQELKDLYFTYLGTYGTESGLMWFLKHEPTTLRDNFDIFLENFFSKVSKQKLVCRLIKKYDHLNLSQRALTFFRQRVSGEELVLKERFVVPLTLLETAEYHLDFIKLYTPVSERVDFKDRDAKALYTLQKSLVKSVHYLNSPSEVLHAIMPFCKGDFLKSSLSPLYSCIYKLPENETKPFIDKLNEAKALSVRKHALHLSCVIYDAKTVHTCLKNATVPSLVATIKYFMKNPSKDLWELIETSITTLQKGQLPLLTMALDLKVLFEYESKYIQMIWETAEKFDDKNLKKILLTKFTKEVVENVDSEFAFRIIRSNLFEAQECYSVVATFLLYLKTDEKYTVLSDILSTFKKNCWDNSNTKKAAHHKLNSFVVKLFEVYMSAKESDPKFVSELTELFESTFPLFEVLQQIVLVRCMVLKKETAENSAKFLIDLNDVFYKQFGLLAVNTFANTLNSYLVRRLFNTLESRTKLSHSLLKFNSSVCDYLLLIKLMLHSEPKSKESYILYNDILSQLGRVSDGIIQLEFNLYLKSE